jgi:hypothetical protein
LSASEERTVKIVKLQVGKQAAVDADCIRIEEQPGGAYQLTTSALCAAEEEGESVSIVGAPLFKTAEEAEAAGVAWATNLGVERLFVSTGTLEHPLELTEIDRDV